MKNMSSQLMVIANKSGTLVLKIEVDHAFVSTHFKGLQIWENKQAQDSSDISATVSIKKLVMFLNWDTLNPDDIRCNILQEKMINLTLGIGDHVRMHYFIPAIVI